MGNDHRKRGSRSRTRSGRHKAPKPTEQQHWFVAYAELAPGLIGMSCVGPLTAEEVPQALEFVFSDPELDCDGMWEWDGEPVQAELERLVQAGQGIGSHPKAVRLILHPKHAEEIAARAAEKGASDLVSSGTGEDIRNTLGIRGSGRMN